jgi:hypothetical protein
MKKYYLTWGISIVFIAVSLLMFSLNFTGNNSEEVFLSPGFIESAVENVVSVDVIWIATIMFVTGIVGVWLEIKRSK